MQDVVHGVLEGVIVESEAVLDRPPATQYDASRHGVVILPIHAQADQVLLAVVFLGRIFASLLQFGVHIERKARKRALKIAVELNASGKKSNERDEGRDKTFGRVGIAG